MPQRNIMHLDLNYFLAACEEKRNPSLKGKPVIVCVYSGRFEDAGAVSTCNYEARKLGVKSGMPILAAKKLAKDAVYLPTDHGYYSEISERVMEILRKHADKFEQVSIDEAFLDVTARVDCSHEGSQKANGGHEKAEGLSQNENCSYEKAEQLAKEIKNEIFGKEQLKCSVGIGPNKLIAKIASDFQKPDGLTIVQAEKVKDFLGPMQVSKLLGVGPKTTEILNKIGIETIAQLRDVSLEKLKDALGENRALWLKEESNGIDESEVIENYEQQQMSRITTLKKDASSLAEIKPILEEISKEVFERVSASQLFFKTVSIIAITNKYVTHTKSKTFERPTNKLETILEIVGQLFELYFKERPEEQLRRIGVRVANFSGKDAQKTLFEF